MKLYFVLFFSLLYSIQLNGQSACTFQTMNDTVICGPNEIELWVKGNGLDKINWFGENITSDDTLKRITAQVNKTTTYYVSNRILDPINLVRNGDFESGDQDFTSNYWSSCYNGSMPQGSYCINTNTNTYWPSWNSCSDHTKTGIGNMFVTDGAITEDEEIWCQTVTVEQNTDYALSAWITPVLNLNNAILQFTINNDTIGAPYSSKPVECEWNEFFEIWNSDINNSAKICITNENSESNGNDFAMDDIALNKVCYSEDSVTIQVIDSVKFKLNNDTTICPGDIVHLAPDTMYGINYTYSWSTGGIGNNEIVDNIGDYSLEITHSSGCKGFDEMEITAIDNPESSLFGDTTVCLSIKGGIMLNPGSSKWSVWNHPNGIDTAQTFKATSPGLYDVTMYNGQNCFVSDRIEIQDFCATELFIPNSFTPNGDDINETFGAEAIETYSFHFQIYNRLGKVIFDTYSLREHWDGKGAPQGTYIYKLNYEQINNETGVLQDYEKIGLVTLLR